MKNAGRKKKRKLGMVVEEGKSDIREKFFMNL
jgi:hypothetical protein